MSTLPADPIEQAKQLGLQLEASLPEIVEGSVLPQTVFESEASALTLHIATLRREADQIEAAAAKFVEERRNRVERLLAWFGGAMRTLAQQAIGKRSPRRMTLPYGTLSLRKGIDKLVAIEGVEAEKAFRVWDARADHKWTRISAKFGSLTREDLDELLNLLPEHLIARLHYEIEPRKDELNRNLKETGEVPPGFMVEAGEDQLTITGE